MNEEQDKRKNKEIDKISGVETTGHEWDGLKELNNPLPRWWLWVFYACVAWSLWYFVVYPSWPIPGGATKGTSGYTQFKALEASQNEIIARQKKYLEKFETASFEQIMEDPELYAFAMAGGRSSFKDNCATCHGTGAQGSLGYPNLNDDDWLWGGTLEDIHSTLLYGIRSGHEETKQSQMPAFGKDHLLKSEEINHVVDYVFALPQGGELSSMVGHKIYQTNCSSCHGSDGRGDRDFGAPNLADSIWLYGGDRSDVYSSIYNARAGVMPSWKQRLNHNTLRQLSVYVHQLGGGEKAEELPIIIAVPQEGEDVSETEEPVDER